MKTFLVVVAVLVGGFCYAGSDAAKQHKAVVIATAKETAPKVLKSAKEKGAKLADATSAALQK